MTDIPAHKPNDTKAMRPRNYLREHLREVPAFRALVRSVECKLFDEAGTLEAPVFDLGCGDGHFASIAFAEPLFAGIDPDERSLRKAYARGGHVHLVRGSAARLPLADASFNTVVSNCVMEHISNLDATLSETFRILRPGGRLLFGVPSHLFADLLLGSVLLRSSKLSRLSKAYGDWFNRHSLHYHTYTPQVWCARLAQHGFDVEHWEYYLTPAAHRAFDLAHYLSVPRLLSHKLTGKWVAFPNPVSNYFFERWLRPHYEARPTHEGPYIFFHARKVGEHPNA